MQIKSFREKKKSQDISKGKQTIILIDNRILLLVYLYTQCIRIWDAFRSEIMSQNDKVPSWDQWVGYVLCTSCGDLLLVFCFFFRIKSYQIILG